MSQEPQRRAPVPVIVHLSGARRGTTQRLRGEILRIGTGPEVEIHVAHEPGVAPEHARLIQREDSYLLQTEPERPVWVNGQAAEHRLLASGDVLEVGPDGPILRFRLYPPGSPAYKSPAQAFADCLECARHGASTPIERAAVLLAGTPKELATQTSLWFRGFMIIGLLALVLFVALLARSFTRLEDRLQREELRISGINELLDSSEQEEVSPEDLDSVRVELRTALERVEALEARTDAPARIVAESSQSVVFLQGSYGFVEPRSGLPLRFAGLGNDGQPLRTADGAPLIGIGGEGPVLEAMFTGTAFVGTIDGLLLTNRHVALPWAYDAGAKQVQQQGFLPVMRRFIGYLPGQSSPFQVDLVVASGHADLAVLSIAGAAGRVAPLAIGESTPDAGDEILVLGYPTGIRALLARTDEAFVDELAAGAPMDFWSITRRLAAAGHIAPLASRGIVAQVTSTVVVYDAETTRGGSGGPVLDLEGRVVAVTSAIVPEFGGSNLGVPARQVHDLLEVAHFRRALPIRLR